MSAAERAITAERAVFLRDFLAGRLEREFPATHRLLAALPDDQSEWRPHEKSTPASALAWHLVESELLLLDAVARGSFAEFRPADKAPERLAHVIKHYVERFPESLAAVRALSGDVLAAPVPFQGRTAPLVTHLAFVLGHTAHHRGQLSAYLRSMGAFVPGVYGKSADERAGEG